ncbi:glucokinase [Rhodobacteraceae bacterium]|nr:glucokinase [Paracoccaceae bacterium]
MTEPLCLLADIGGTNTRMALSDGKVLRDASIERFKNADYAEFSDIIRAYLTAQGIARVDRACVAAAGPVADGRAEMTNLDWTIADTDIAAASGADHVGLLNDLQAQGHSLRLLKSDDIETVMAGTHVPRDGDTQIVIGMGTGFNAAPVYHAAHGTYVPPAEIGHARIAVADDTQITVAKYVAKTEGFISNEHILAGRGLERIDAALNLRTDRSAAEIMAAASAGDDSAILVANTQASFAGGVYGDMALATLPLGGIYLIGGVARALTPYLASDVFSNAFRAKGRFSEFNHQFTVHVILDDFAALKGCANFIA